MEKPETFRQDRIWSATDDLDPDSCVTLADKLAFQRELRRRIEAAEIPSLPAGSYSLTSFNRYVVAVPREVGSER